MINNDTISRIYVLTNPILINDTTGFYIHVTNLTKPDFKNIC